jgi:diguanylate cyclase (GGDEF)-like protein/PAS domain S-box-containing protein
MRAVIPSRPEFGGLGCQTAPASSESQVRSLLDSKVSGIAKRVLPGVGIYLLLTCVFDTVADPAEAGFGFLMTWVSGLAVAATGVALSRKTIPARLANAAVSCAALAVLIEALVRFLRTTPARPTIHIVVLLVGVSATLLSHRWLALVVASSLGSWLAVAGVVRWPGDSPVMVTLTTLLCVAAACAFLIHHQRFVAYRSRFEESLIEAQRNETLKQIQSRYESAVRGANDGLWFWDLASERIFVSARWMQMVGHPNSSGATQLQPEEWFDAVDPYYVAGLKAAIHSHLEGHSPHVEYKHRMQRQDGTYIWVLTRGLVTREAGRGVSIAGSMTDISHVTDIEQRLVQDALQDKLTGLANRHSLMIELQAAAERSLQSGKAVGVVFIDLDDFKLVNDSLGHQVGDQILTQVAQKLFVCRRPGDTLARYGGDEFVLVLENLSNPGEAEEIGHLMQQVLSTPIEVNGHSMKVTASVGIANSGISWRHDELIRNADIAMYQAKAAGKGELRVFNSEMYHQARRSWELYNVVQGLVDREECSLQYQPIVSTRSGDIAGVEALFRWRNPNNQRQSTIDLIVAAEHTGSIVEIGKWVVARACAEAAVWQRRGLPAIPISVNVSAHQLRLPDFAQHVANILRDEGLSPESLELELTETAYMQDIPTVWANLDALVKLGVGLAVDDFGTGFSSLSYLAKFPLRTLKIDGAFVSGIGVNPQVESLTTGIISLAHSLGLTVTAEKVETEEQLEFLSREGCDRVQGYLASAPLSPRQFAQVLESEDRLIATLPFAPRLVRRPVRALPLAVGT